MQTAVPDLMDLAGETEATQQLYGLDAKYARQRASFGRQCLLARRLVERGVRFVELTCPSVGHDRWDQHSNLEEGPRGQRPGRRSADRRRCCKICKQRGLLDETLVVWAGEFGRTPFAQGTDGRDHNPFGFTSGWPAAASRAARSTAQTDEYGYKAVENKAEIHDLHATMLHLLGIDHTRADLPLRRPRHAADRRARACDSRGNCVTAEMARTCRQRLCLGIRSAIP